MTACEEELVESEVPDSQDLRELENNAFPGVYSIICVLVCIKYCYAVGDKEDKIICFVSMILQLIGNQCKFCPLPAKAAI